MKREQALAKNTLIISIGTMLPKLTTIVTLPILTAGLTKSEYGTFDLISTLVSLFLPIVTLKLDMGIFRYLIEYREDVQKKKEVITTSFISIVIISSIAVILAYFLLRSIPIQDRLLVCIYFFVDTIFVMLQQGVRGLSKNFLYSIGTVVYSLVNLTGIIVLVSVVDKGLEGLLLSMIIANVFAIFVLAHRSHILQGLSIINFSVDILKDMLSYSWPLIPNSLSLWVMNLSDRLIISLYLGIEANAVYAVANKIPNLLVTLQSSFSAAWMENASLSVKDGDTDEYYSNMFDVTFRMLIGITAGLIAVLPIVFSILIRGDYDTAYVQMPILCMGMLFSSLSSFMGGIYIAQKKTRSVGITTVLAALCNLIIDLVFVNFIGIFSASISTLVSYVFLALYRMYDVQKFQAVKYDMRKFVGLIAALVFMCGICWMNTLMLNILNFCIGLVLAVTINKKVIAHIFKALKNKRRR